MIETRESSGLNAKEDLTHNAGGYKTKIDALHWNQNIAYRDFRVSVLMQRRMTITKEEYG